MSRDAVSHGKTVVMDSDARSHQLSRRSSLLAAAGLALTVGSVSVGRVRAQVDQSTHPIVGAWLVRTPDNGLQPSFFNADGTFFASTVDVQFGADGTVTYLTPQNGVWEPDPENELGIHFISIQSTFDTAGIFLGTWIVDGYPIVSEDGATLADDWARSRVTIRDANNEILQVLGNDGSIPAIHGTRLTVDNLVFPGPAVPAATPAP